MKKVHRVGKITKGSISHQKRHPLPSVACVTKTRKELMRDIRSELGLRVGVLDEAESSYFTIEELSLIHELIKKSKALLMASIKSDGGNNHA